MATFGEVASILALRLIVRPIVRVVLIWQEGVEGRHSAAQSALLVSHDLRVQISSRVCKT